MEGPAAAAPCDLRLQPTRSLTMGAAGALLSGSRATGHDVEEGLAAPLLAPQRPSAGMMISSVDGGADDEDEDEDSSSEDGEDEDDEDSSSDDDLDIDVDATTAEKLMVLEHDLQANPAHYDKHLEVRQPRPRSWATRCGPSHDGCIAYLAACTSDRRCRCVGAPCMHHAEASCMHTLGDGCMQPASDACMLAVKHRLHLH